MRSHCHLPSLIGAIVSSFLLTGCALGTRHVAMIYPPAIGHGTNAVVTAESTPIANVGDKPIIVIRFVDERDNPNQVGSLKNGYGMDTGTVVPDGDVAQWVTDAIAYELGREGYTVVRQDGTNEAAGVVLSGEIVTVTCSAQAMYESEVSFFARVTRDGKELERQRFTGHGNGGLNWAYTNVSFSQTLALALNDAVLKLLIDLKVVLKE